MIVRDAEQDSYWGLHMNWSLKDATGLIEYANFHVRQLIGTAKSWLVTDTKSALQSVENVRFGSSPTWDEIYDWASTESEAAYYAAYDLGGAFEDYIGQSGVAQAIAENPEILAALAQVSRKQVDIGPLETKTG